jgi:2-dehydropantoate 2-reductase
MKIAVFGAGAIGSYVAGRLALSGADVTLVGRGPHFETVARGGLRVIDRGVEEHAGLRCATPDDAGEQDVVYVTVKGHQMTAALPSVLPLLGPETAVVTAQNGVPWWYTYGLDGPLREQRLEAVDPGGAIWEALGPRRAIGCVLYHACKIEAPGVVSQIDPGSREILGEPGGTSSERLQEFERALDAAKLNVTTTDAIRSVIWVKLWGNAVFNPVSVLTGGTLEGIASHSQTRAFVRTAMLEVEAVANALGEQMTVDVDKRIDMAKSVGPHKTSLLQDFEAGRSLEIEPLTGAVLDLARLTGVPVPSMEGIDALLRLAAESNGWPAGQSMKQISR